MNKSSTADAQNDTKTARHASPSFTAVAHPDWQRYQSPPETVAVLVGCPQLTVVSTVAQGDLRKLYGGLHAAARSRL